MPKFAPTGKNVAVVEKLTLGQEGRHIPTFNTSDIERDGSFPILSTAHAPYTAILVRSV